MSKDELILLIAILQDKISMLKQLYATNEARIIELTNNNIKIMKKSLQLDKMLKDDYKLLSNINAQEGENIKR